MTAKEFENKILTQMTESVIHELEELIKQGKTVRWQCPWKFAKPHNYITGSDYNGLNRLYFSMLGISEIITWAQLNAYNIAHFGLDKTKYAKPKKDAKQYPYIFYKPRPYTKTIEHDDGTEEEVEKMGFTFKCYFGYDVRDIDGLKATEVYPTYDNPNIIKADEIIASSACPIRYTTVGAFYSVESDYIQVADIKHCSSSEEFYSTVFHEMGHSTGAKSRLDRDLSGSSETAKYRTEELIAEFTSVMLCEECGIANVTKDNSIAYLQSYIKALRNDVRLLYRCASKAQKAFDWIMANKAKQEVKAS